MTALLLTKLDVTWRRNEYFMEGVGEIDFLLSVFGLMFILNFRNICFLKLEF
jgi:hypothetical protein